MVPVVLSVHAKPQLGPLAAAGPLHGSRSVIGRQPAALTGALGRRLHRTAHLCQAKRKGQGSSGSTGDEMPERLSAAEPLEAELSDKAKELRRRGKAALDAAQQAAAAGADLAATAAEEAANAPEEAASLAAGAAQDLASDAADVAGSAQMAEADVQQEASAAVLGAVSDAASDATDVVGSVQSAAQDVAEQAAEAGLSVLADVASDAADVAGSVSTAAQDVQGQRGDVVAGAVAAAASDAADVAGSVQTAARGMQGKTGDMGRAAVADISSDAADVVESVETAAQRVASDAADVADSVETAVIDVQEEVSDAVLGAVSDAASDAADVADSVQAAAQDVRAQAASGRPAPKTAAQLLAAEPTAGELEAPQPVAGALPAAGETSGALPPPPSSSGSSPPPGATAEDASSETSAEKKRKADEIHKAKDVLVSMLASLDRGSAATCDQMERVDELARRLEKLGGTVSLGWERPAAGGKPGMALLDGRWRLLYSSGFSSGSLGGRRPGPSFGSGPVTLGQVHQDIYTDKSELDNVVDLFLRTSLAALPLPGMDIAIPSATARLRHTFSIIGANTVEITFTDTEVKLAGGVQGWLDGLPRFTLPALPEWLQPPKTMRSARFDVCFLDEDMRITRGDRGELRVFMKGMV